MSIYGSEIYSTLETNYLISDIYFTSLDTVGISANLIRVSTDMTIGMGYISGLTNVNNLSSAVNKYYVDNSSQFIPYGTIGSIQFKSNDETMTSSEDLTFTSTNNILKSVGIETNNCETENLFLSELEINASDFTINYNLILPITNGTSGQILGLNNSALKVSDETFLFINGGSIWSPVNKKFLTTLSMLYFNTTIIERPTFGLSENGLQWTTYLYSSNGGLFSPLWINNSYIVSYSNGFLLNPVTTYKLLKSTDGLIWESIFETDKGLPGICYSEYLQTYVGITIDQHNLNTNSISLLSIDLINWTTYQLNFNIAQLSPQILWINELKIFITYHHNIDSYFISSNGIDWDIYNNILGFIPSSCTWAPELGIISLTGRDNCGISYDGINWITSSYKFNTSRAALLNTVWCPPIENIRQGYFVSTIGGEPDPEFLKPVISTDGLNWFFYSDAYGGNYAGVAYQPENDIVSIVPSYLAPAYLIDFGNYLTYFDNGFIPAGSNTDVQYGLNGIFVSDPNLTFDKNTNTISVTSPNTILVDTSIITNVNTNKLFISNTLLKSNNSFVDYTINLPDTPPNNNEILVTDGIDTFSFTTNTSTIPKGSSTTVQKGYSGNIEASNITFDPDTELYIPGSIKQYNQIPFTTINSINTTIESFYLYGDIIYTVGNDKLSFIPTDDFQIINQLTFTSCSRIFINGYYSFITDNESLIISDISGNGLYYNTQISITQVSTSGTPIPLYVYNNYCYLGLSNTLITIDVSDVTSPTTLSEINISNINNIIVYEDYMYLTNNTNFMKLSIDNITPTTLKSLSISNLNSLTINNGYGYVANNSIIYTVELTNFTTKVQVPILNTNCLYSTYGSLYIGTDNDIFVINILNPLSQSLLNTITDTNINGITVLGMKMYYFNNTDLIILDTKGSELTSMSCGNIYTNQIMVMNNFTNEGLTISNTINVSNTLNVENIKLYKEIINLIDYSDITTTCYNAIINISDSSSIQVNNYADITVTNNNVTNNSQINVGILGYQFGLPYISIINKINGEFTIRIYNFRDTLYGIIKLYFIIY